MQTKDSIRGVYPEFVWVCAVVLGIRLRFMKRDVEIAIFPWRE